jgi:hypothetical protein
LSSNGSSNNRYTGVRREAEHWFIGAIAASLLWILFVILIIFLRKKIQMVSLTFDSGGKKKAICAAGHKKKNLPVSLLNHLIA